MKESTAFKLVKDELDRVMKDFPTHNSPHESYAILKEELEELWDEIKAGKGTTDRGVSEAVQVATVAIRYLIDHCADQQAVEHEEKVERWNIGRSKRKPKKHDTRTMGDWQPPGGPYYSG